MPILLDPPFQCPRATSSTSLIVSIVDDLCSTIGRLVVEGEGFFFFEKISPSRYACARSLDKVYVPLPTYLDFRRRWWSAPYLTRVRPLALNGPCVGGRTLRNTRGYFLFLCATFLTRGAAWVGVENGGERQWEGGL